MNENLSENVIPSADEPDFSYLDMLNPQQRAAVVYKDGPALVIAGASQG